MATLQYLPRMRESPRETINAINNLSFDFTSGAVIHGAVGDKVQFGKLPDGAIITCVDFVQTGFAAMIGSLIVEQINNDGTFTTLNTLVSGIASEAGVITTNFYIPTKVIIPSTLNIPWVLLSYVVTTAATTPAVGWLARGTCYYDTMGGVLT